MSSVAMAAQSSWDNIPQIPSNRRSQFYLMRNNGDYEYGYDSGDGSSAQQSSSSGNQVVGSYSYVDDLGRLVDVKYSAGVNGFVPEITINGKSDPQFRHLGKSPSHASIDQPKLLSTPKISIRRNSDKISYDSGNHQHEAESDGDGNVRGFDSYSDDLGRHDLSYIAGLETGHQVVGGSLANLDTPTVKNHKNQKFSSDELHQKSDDAAFNYEFDVGSHAKKESSNAAGNVRGSFRYSDEAGHVMTGGSLAKASNQKPEKFIKNKLRSSPRQNVEQLNALFFRNSNWDESTKNVRVQDLMTQESSDETAETPLQFPNDQRTVNQAKHLHPSFTIITPEVEQHSFEFGVRNAVILGFLPPKHETRFGYIYDTL